MLAGVAAGMQFAPTVGTPGGQEYDSVALTDEFVPEDAATDPVKQSVPCSVPDVQP